MLEMKSNKPAFFALRIMGNVSDKNIFRAKDFNQEMKKIGYTTPQKYIWAYTKKRLIKRIQRGYYKLF